MTTSLEPEITSADLATLATLAQVRRDCLEAVERFAAVQTSADLHNMRSLIERTLWDPATGQGSPITRRAVNDLEFQYLIPLSNKAARAAAFKTLGSAVFFTGSLAIGFIPGMVVSGISLAGGLRPTGRLVQALRSRRQIARLSRERDEKLQALKDQLTADYHSPTQERQRFDELTAAFATDPGSVDPALRELIDHLIANPGDEAELRELAHHYGQPLAPQGIRSPETDELGEHQFAEICRLANVPFPRSRDELVDPDTLNGLPNPLIQGGRVERLEKLSGVGGFLLGFAQAAPLVITNGANAIFHPFAVMGNQVFMMAASVGITSLAVWTTRSYYRALRGVQRQAQLTIRATKRKFDAAYEPAIDAENRIRQLGSTPAHDVASVDRGSRIYAALVNAHNDYQTMLVRLGERLMPNHRIDELKDPLRTQLIDGGHVSPPLTSEEQTMWDAATTLRREQGWAPFDYRDQDYATRTSQVRSRVPQSAFAGMTDDEYAKLVQWAVIQVGSVGPKRLALDDSHLLDDFAFAQLTAAVILRSEYDRLEVAGTSAADLAHFRNTNLFPTIRQVANQPRNPNGVDVTRRTPLVPASTPPVVLETFPQLEITP